MHFIILLCQTVKRQTNLLVKGEPLDERGLIRCSQIVYHSKYMYTKPWLHKTIPQCKLGEMSHIYSMYSTVLWLQKIYRANLLK